MGSMMIDFRKDVVVYAVFCRSRLKGIPVRSCIEANVRIIVSHGKFSRSFAQRNCSRSRLDTLCSCCNMLFYEYLSHVFRPDTIMVNRFQNTNSLSLIIGRWERRNIVLIVPTHLQLVR